MPSIPVNIVVIVLTVIVALIIAINTLRGFMGGSRKSLYKLCSTIVFWVIFFATSHFLSGAFIWQNEGIYSLISKIPFLPQVEGATNFLEYIKLFLAQTFSIEPEVLSDPSFDANIILIGMFIVKLLYLGLLRGVHAIASTIVYNVFFRSRCDFSEKTLEKLEQMQEQHIDEHEEPSERIEKMIESQENRVNKRGLIKGTGAIVGVVRGLVGCFLVLAFVNTIAFTIPDMSGVSYGAVPAEAAEVDSSGEYGTRDSGNAGHSYLFNDLISQNEIGKFIVDAITEYQKSFLSRVTGLDIGGKRLDMIFVDGIFSGEYRDGEKTYQLVFREEIENAIKVAEDVAYATDGFHLEGFDFFSLEEDKVERLQRAVDTIGDSNLLTNLLPVATSVLLNSDMDELKNIPIPRDVLSAEEIRNINWTKDIKTLAKLVPEVSKLADSMQDFDFFAMDKTAVANIFTIIGELESVQPIMKAVSYMGVEMLFKDEDGVITDQETLDKVKEDLANVIWSQDISDIGTLYGKFLDLGIVEKIKNVPEGETPNFIQIFTSLKEEEVDPVIDTLFKLSFVENVLPDVVGILREKVPEEYRDMISPNVTQAQDWLNELKSVFGIISDITDNGDDPIDDMASFDFNRLKDIRTETLLSSKILSHIVISLLVDVSNGTSNLGTELGDYIKVPDELTAKNEDGEYSPKWYESEEGGVITHGELYSIFETLKSIASELDFSGETDPFEIASGLIRGIDPDTILSSSILHYTLSNLMTTQLGEILQIPAGAFDEDVTVNGSTLHLVKKSEIRSLINGIKELNLNLNTIFGDIFAIANCLGDENGDFNLDLIGGLFTPGDDYSEILHSTVSGLVLGFTNDNPDAAISLSFPEETKENETGYIASEEIVNLFKAIFYLDLPSLFDSSSSSDMLGTVINNEHVDEIMDSMIIRSALTGFLATTDFGLTIPIEDCADAVTVSYGGGSPTPLDNYVISKAEFTNLFNAITALKNAVGGDSYTDVFNLGNLSVDGINRAKDTLLDSKIIYATVSGKIIDLAGSGMLSVIIDEDLYSDPYLDRTEIGHLIEAISIILDGGNISNFNEINPASLMEKDNISDTFNSKIILATISSYLESVPSIVIPGDVKTAGTDISGNAFNTIDADEINNVLAVYSALKEKINEGRAPGEELSGADILNVSNIRISYLADDDIQDAIIDSAIVKATLSYQIAGNGAITIGIDAGHHSISNPTVVLYDGTYIIDSELRALFKSMSMITSGPVLGMEFDSAALLGMDDDELEDFFGSEIIVNTVSQKIYDMMDSNDALEFLTYAMDNDHGFTATTVTKAEEKALYKAIKVFGSGNISSISFTFDTLKGLTDAEIADICSSNLISWNVYSKIKAENDAPSGLNGILVLDRVDGEAVNHRYWYADNGLAGDNLYSLVKTLRDLYADPTFESAFTDVQADTSGFGDFKNADFIKLITGDIVLCDSLPNIIENFTSALDPRLHAIYKEPYASEGGVYTPVRDDMTDEAWKTWWRGSLNDCSDGELYKLFDAIIAVNNIANDVFGYPPSMPAEEDVTAAQSSTIINETIIIPSA